MTPINSFSYFFRKYPLFRTVMWLLLICIAIIVLTIINLRFTHEPVLDSVNPPIGFPGDIIVLKGDYFGNVRNESYVEIGGERLTASSYISWTKNEIKIVLPSNIQEGLVIVDISGRRSKPSVFTNESTIPITVPPNPRSKTPEIISISPNIGAVGQLITIVGTNFGDVRENSRIIFKTNRETNNSSELSLSDIDSVNKLFANAEDYDYELWSDSEIKVRIPDGAVSGNITIETAKGSSHSEEYIINNRGTKTFLNSKSYLIQVTADISHITAAINSSLTLHIPRPITMSSQPTVEMTECTPTPLLDNYRNTVIHQIEFKELHDDGQKFTQNFMAQVYEISCKIEQEKVRPFTDKESTLYIENTKATQFIPADAEEIKTLGSSIIKKQRNPYMQANLVYNYILENFSLLQSTSVGDFNLQNVLESKQADAYDMALLYTSILRSIGIPAKMMSGVLVDAELKSRNHWWNEFYIENFGWIPVDLALSAGLSYTPFQSIEDKNTYYFGNLDSQHIAFSSNWEIIKPSMVNNKIVYRPRSYALQNIWEEASVETDSYSSFWNTPVVSGLY